MQTLVLERPPTPRNMPPVDRTEAPCNPPSRPPPKTAREILADSDWAVIFPRAKVLEHNNHRDFAAFLCWAASRALWDRGLRGPPSEGWPTLTGMSARSWYTAKLRAVALGLVRVVPGGGIEPLVRYEPGQGQYSRVPTSILFGELSRTTKRVFIGLALFSDRIGHARAAVTTIAKASSTHRRDVQRSLTELENHFHLTRRGAGGGASMRYFVKGQAISYPQKGASPKGKIGNETHPSEAKSATTPTPKSATTPTRSRVFTNKDLHQGHVPPVPLGSQAPRGPTKAEARCTLNRFGMRGAGVDFGKPAKNCPQGKAKPVVEPPTEPHWRPLRDGQIFEKNWEAETLRLCSAGLFQTAKNAVPQLPRRKEIAK